MQERDHQKPLDNYELAVYITYQNLQEPGITPNNKVIAEIISDKCDITISKNAVARARRRIAHKLQLKRGW